MSRRLAAALALLGSAQPVIGGVRGQSHTPKDNVAGFEVSKADYASDISILQAKSVLGEIGQR
jgi:hypothetical protein